MARRSYTVGIVGLGFGRAHIPAFQANGCQVIAVCQRDRAAAQAVATRYQVPQVFERWEEMIERARPEIVVVATPPVLHQAIATAAFAAGAHVLCEKPFAMSVAEGRAIVEAASRAGRIGMTSFNWRFISAMQRFNAIAAESVGRPFHVDGHWQGGRSADPSTPATWRLDRAMAGHGAMGDAGVHLIDLVRWNFGEFTRVCAQAGIANPSRPVLGGDKPTDAEDFCAVLGELASGAQVTLRVSRAARGRNEHGLDAYGAAGAVMYRVDRAQPRWYRGELSVASGGGSFERVKVPAGLPRSAGEGDAMEVVGKTTIAPLVKRLLGAIRKGEPASPSFEDGLRSQAVLDAVLESETRGGWVSVAG
jgi:predicted dehydrogenase